MNFFVFLPPYCVLCYVFSPCLYFPISYSTRHSRVEKRQNGSEFTMDDDLKNNLSTIAVLVYGVLSPYLAQYLSAEQFSALFIAMGSIVFVLYSAKHPNKFNCLGNGDKCTCSNEETIMNDEYEIDPIEQGDQ